jgi:hypothetical protein
VDFNSGKKLGEPPETSRAPTEKPQSGPPQIWSTTTTAQNNIRTARGFRAGFIGKSPYRETRSGTSRDPRFRKVDAKPTSSSDASGFTHCKTGKAINRLSLPARPMLTLAGSSYHGTVHRELTRTERTSLCAIAVSTEHLIARFNEHTIEPIFVSIGIFVPCAEAKTSRYG